MEIWILHIFVILKFILMSSYTVNSSNFHTVKALLDPDVYDASMPPGYDEGNVTNVKIQAFIKNLHNVRESHMDFEADIFFRQTWQDSRLRHNSSLEKVELDFKLIDSVWVPDTYFVNSKKGDVHMVTVPNKMMHIYRNGTVIYSIHVAMQLTCYMDLANFPLDEQHCPMMIESYSYTKDVVHYEWNPSGDVVLEKNIQIPKFYISKPMSAERCDSDYAGVGSFSCIKTVVAFKRKTGYFILQLFIPSILIVGLSWVSFWIDHESVPARISLGLLTVLTMTTQTSSFKDVLPQVSYIKAIDVWLASCLICVFLALLEYAYVNSVSRRQVNSNKSNSDEEEANDEKEAKSARTSSAGRARKVDKIARVVFPFGFLIFNIVFWTYYSLHVNNHEQER